MEILQYIFDMILLIWELSVDSGFYYILAWPFIISLPMILLGMIFKTVSKFMGKKI